MHCARVQQVFHLIVTHVSSVSGYAVAYCYTFCFGSLAAHAVTISCTHVDQVAANVCNIDKCHALLLKAPAVHAFQEPDVLLELDHLL